MALITTIDELKKYLRIPSSNISSKMPAIEVAEEKYLLPILGEALYTDLSEAFSEDVLSPVQTQLLEKCRSVIAPMSYLGDLPFLQANISDQGVTVMESQNTRKAFRWEYNEIKDALTNNGTSAMESLIIFLRNKRVDFPLWDSAPYNDPELTFILRNGQDLRKTVSVDQPHRTFLLLQGMLPMIIQTQIIPVIGEAFFNEFNERIIADNLTAIEKQLAEHLKQAVARFAMRQAGIERSIKFSGSGFTIVDTTKDQPDDARTDPGEIKMERWRNEMERTANVYLNLAKEYLVKNAEDPAFSSFKNSEAYPTEGKQLTVADNSKRKGIFIMGG